MCVIWSRGFIFFSSKNFVCIHDFFSVFALCLFFFSIRVRVNRLEFPMVKEICAVGRIFVFFLVLCIVRVINFKYLQVLVKL